MVSIQSDFLSAEISVDGAELIAFRERGGGDLLWDGNPEWWTGRAPLLFPIVGKVPDDRITVDGAHYTIQQHGFARRSTFELVAADDAHCHLRLRDSSKTLQQFPFSFELNVVYSVLGWKISVAATILNLADRPMPISFGFHPALRWPLPDGGAKQDHFIEFEKTESAPIRRLQNGLLMDELFDSPVKGNVLFLNDSLFENDALIFDRLRSERLSYVAPSGISLRFEFPGMPHLGIWSKPGAGFVCIEPWQGYAAEEGFQGDLREKPGGIIMMPGTTRTFSMTIELVK